MMFLVERDFFVTVAKKNAKYRIDAKTKCQQ